jgi:hypothetical protein
MLVAVLGLITAWQEAPMLGNHWFVVSFVDLAVLLSALATLRDRNINRDKLAEVFLPLARWCLVLFYSFAAFAKLNTAFFDTAVSCSPSIVCICSLTSLQSWPPCSCYFSLGGSRRALLVFSRVAALGC